MTLGIIARADWGSGLSSQTLNYCKMLNPDKVLIIDSSPFNKATQRFDLYDQFNTEKVMGFPEVGHLKAWFQDLTHILTAETAYSDYALGYAHRMGIKTFVAVNAEFWSHALTPPTKFLMPSYWHLDEYQERYPDKVIYLPPPLFPNDFKEARDVNFTRWDTPRFLHVVGKWASKDRNGTKSLLEALQYTSSEFELVIKSQYPLDFTHEDKRIKWEIGNTENQADLYKDFDALILPRRYGGMSLPCNEALMSGLPVIMSDISPNNRLLPEQWLVQAQVHDHLQTRIMLDVYNTDPQDLASKIDWLCNTSLEHEKALAFEIAMQQFNHATLLPKYEDLLYN